MAKAMGGIRQRLSRAAEAAKGVQRLHASGIVDLGNLGVTLQTVKNSRVYGPQATMAIQGGRKFPSLPAIVDEHGTLSYKQVDEMSNALAHGLKSLGVDEASVVGLLCRDHAGLVVAMASCGKLGARTVLMNTGFAKPQFAQVCEREGVKVVLHDSEFLNLLDALPSGLPRVLTWVDEGTHPPDMPTIDSIIATNSTEPLLPPTKAGGFVVLTSGTTGLPKGAPRAKLSPFATVQLIDRVPYPRKGTMVIVSPIFHSPAFRSRRHPQAHCGPQGRHVGSGPDDAAPHGRTRARRHRKVRRVDAEGDSDRRVGADARPV
jgi:fatty-acyl-CoA synthase